MKMKKLTWLSLFLICHLLAACSTLPSINSLISPETELFAEGLDEVIASGKLATLKALPQKYPKGEWRPRAEAIVALVEKQQANKKLLDAQNQELDRCQQEKAFLEQDNKSLEKTLERLKQVLIDMERQKN